MPVPPAKPLRSGRAQSTGKGRPLPVPPAEMRIALARLICYIAAMTTQTPRSTKRRSDEATNDLRRSCSQTRRAGPRRFGRA